VTWAIEEKCYSQRACGLVGLDPKTFRYASRSADDTAVRARLKELALERRRFGYRRLHILLRREGIELNHKKLFRLYREERPTVKKRGSRKRALGTRAPSVPRHGSGTSYHRRMEDRLQRAPAAHEPARPHTERVCNQVQIGPQGEQSPVVNEG
jgi:transposase InsO family protein